MQLGTEPYVALHENLFVLLLPSLVSPVFLPFHREKPTSVTGGKTA